jgi:hypothetical protein
MVSMSKGWKEKEQRLFLVVDLSCGLSGRVSLAWLPEGSARFPANFQGIE